MDQQIICLQKQLALIQQQSSPHISQRLALQILLKVKQKNVDIVHSLDGNYIYTHNSIREQILSIVNESDRIQIFQIASQINLPSDLIQIKIQQLRRQKYILVFERVIVTHKYIKKIINQIREKLDYEGQVSIIQICQIAGLSAKSMTQIVQNQKIGIYQQGMLVSPFAIKQRQRKLLGSLRAAVKPFKLTNLGKIYSQQKVDYFIQKKQLIGIRQGQIFIPQTFQTYKQKLVKDQFQCNGFLQYQTLSSYLQIQIKLQQIKHLLSQLSQITYLQNFCVKNKLLKLLVDEISRSFNHVGFYQIDLLLPCPFQHYQLIQILKKADIKKIAIANSIVFKQSFINTITDIFNMRCIVEIGFDSCVKKKKKNQIVFYKEIIPLMIQNKILDHSQKNSSLADALQKNIPQWVDKHANEIKKLIKNNNLVFKGIKIKGGVQFFSSIMSIPNEFMIEFARRVKVKTIPKQLQSNLLDFCVKYQKITKELPVQYKLIQEWISKLKVELLQDNIQNASFAYKHWPFHYLQKTWVVKYSNQIRKQQIQNTQKQKQKIQ